VSPSVSVRLLLTQSDARLVELAREGHERAFEALVQRYRRPLLAYCRRLLLRDERAEDALQQGLLQAWLALQDGRAVREAKPWLYRIVHNCALNALRVSGYDYNTLSESLRGADAPEHDLDRRIAVRQTLAGLAALPELQREALMRTALDGHSHEQVARALGLSEGALRGLVYRARVTLRAAATALTPPPVVSWALAHRTWMSAPLIARVAEAGAGGGSVGLGGALLKGGTIAVTAGALAGGIVATRHAATHHHPRPASNPSSRQVLLAQANGALPGAAGDARQQAQAGANGRPTDRPAHARRGRGSPFAIIAPRDHQIHRLAFHELQGAGYGDGVSSSGDLDTMGSNDNASDGSSGDRKGGDRQSVGGDRQSVEPASSEDSRSSKDGAGSGASALDGGSDKATAPATSGSSGSGDGSNSSSGDGMSSDRDSTSSASDSSDSQSGASSGTSTSGGSDGDSGGEAPSIS
jgi:RNA polymerase sigma factor (sigma-70 family)